MTRAAADGAGVYRPELERMPRRATRPWIDAFAFAAGLMGGILGVIAASAVLTVPSPRRPTRGRRPRAEEMETLPRRIFGYTKREVARLLGPPHAAALGAPVMPPTYWKANTWYYPVDPRRQTAVAVQFDDDRVIRVELLGR
jgi:outer membrane protein assembly factor BamE (lipoprotein component of BamABCDE complex)